MRFRCQQRQESGGNIFFWYCICMKMKYSRASSFGKPHKKLESSSPKRLTRGRKRQQRSSQGHRPRSGRGARSWTAAPKKLRRSVKWTWREERKDSADWERRYPRPWPGRRAQNQFKKCKESCKESVGEQVQNISFVFCAVAQ